MHKFIKNIFKMGIILAVPVFIMTACAGREDAMLELDIAEQTREMDNAAETGGLAGTDGLAFSDNAAGADGSVETESAALNGVEDSDKNSAPLKIYVHICGAVVNPGVYELEDGSRVFEGIEAAGGLREDACGDYVNQASALKDGERLVIPTLEEIETAKAEGNARSLWEMGAADENAAAAASAENSGASASMDGDGRVNINTATESELGNINGIGQGKAAAIVQYRQENGSFASIEDIMNVSGIKEGTYEKIKDKITVN